MTEGNIVFEGKIENQLDIIIRYPTPEDAELMCNYINILSDERTFVRFQGEKMTLENEKKFLEELIPKIEDKKAVMLLCFHKENLIGISEIGMGDKTERHVGTFALSISKDYRGKGIGKFFMSKVLEESEAQMPSLELVSISAFSTNTIARSLYKKMGFIEYGTLPNGVKLENGYIDQVMMYKVVRAHNK